MRPLSISTALFDGYPVEQALHEIAEAGVPFVEPAYISGYTDFDEADFSDRSAEALVGRIREAGLAAVAVSAHVGAGEANAPEYLLRRLGFAAGIGAGVLIANPGPATLRDGMKRNLDAVLPRCAELGVVIALENPGHGTDALITAAGDGVQLVSAFGSPWLRLNLDFGNVFTYSHETIAPQSGLEAALPWIAQAHVKDVRASIDGWEFTAIGDGSIDYGAIAQALSRLAPALPVCLELPLRLSRPARRDPVRRSSPQPMETIRIALRRSVRFWREADTSGAL